MIHGTRAVATLLTDSSFLLEKRLPNSGTDTPGIVLNIILFYKSVHNLNRYISITGINNGINNIPGQAQYVCYDVALKTVFFT